MRRTPTLIPVVCLCLLSLTVQAQKKPKPTPVPKPVEEEDVVRISTELVQTDVTVFDKDGKFVSGLKPEEFELSVEGKPQPIALFESIVTGGRREESVLRSAGGKKTTSQPAPADSGESIPGRTILFFVNDLHLDPNSLSRTHKLLDNFVDRMLGPNDQVAITSASGQIGFLQQLTSNPAVLHAAADRLKMVPGATSDSQRPYISPYAAYVMQEQHDRQLFEFFVDQTIKMNSMSPQDGPIAASMVEQRTRTILVMTDAAVKNSLSSLVTLMRSTAKLPGRKLVFFISDGFMGNFTGSDFTAMMDRATGAANRSSVVIYTIDARGLSTDSMFDASSGGSDPTGIMQSHLSGERTFMQEPLHALAADTGGRALLNSNDLEGGIARALDETSHYYLLAWRPENDAQRASNFSKIKVRITDRPDLKVQLRRGYLGAPPEKSKAAEVQPTSVETTDVLGVTESSSEELRAAVAVGYKRTSGANMQLTTTAQVNAEALGDSGGGTIVVNVLGAVFDSNGKGVGSFRQRVEVTRTRATGPPVYTNVNHQVDLPPGLYQVRVIAAERGTNHLTGVMDWIELPKLKEGTFSISSMFVGEIPESGGNGQIGVNAGRRFARSSRLRFTTYIYNAATPPQLSAQIKILRGNQAVLAPPEINIATDKAGNATNIPYAGEFPLNSLPSGDYILELTVTDRTRKTSATQRLPITVF